MDLSSWQEGLLFGVPMVAMLLAMFFHLDELWTGPSNGVGRRLAGGVDRNGMPICLEPDGRELGRMLSHAEFRRLTGRGGDWSRVERK